MRGAYQHTAVHAARRLFSGNDPQALSRYLAQRMDGRTPQARDQRDAVFEIALVVLAGAEAAGLLPRAADDPEMDLWLRSDHHIRRADVAHALADVHSATDVDGRRLSMVINAAWEVCKTTRIDWPEWSQPRAEDAPIQRVAIVSEPTRITTTEVTRDRDGNIRDARQIERDAGAVT